MAKLSITWRKCYKVSDLVVEIYKSKPGEEDKDSENSEIPIDNKRLELDGDLKNRSSDSSHIWEDYQQRNMKSGSSKAF